MKNMFVNDTAYISRARHLKLRLQQTTVLGCAVIFGGIVLNIALVKPVMAACTGGSNSYTCAGTIGSTENITATGDLSVGLSGIVNTALNFTGTKVFNLDGSGHNIIYSGGSTDSSFSLSGQADPINIYARTSGAGLISITNNAALNISDASGSNLSNNIFAWNTGGSGGIEIINNNTIIGTNIVGSTPGLFMAQGINVSNQDLLNVSGTGSVDISNNSNINISATNPVGSIFSIGVFGNTGGSNTITNHGFITVGFGDISSGQTNIMAKASGLEAVLGANNALNATITARNLSGSSLNITSGNVTSTGAYTGAPDYMHIVQNFASGVFTGILPGSMGTFRSVSVNMENAGEINAQSGNLTASGAGTHILTPNFASGMQGVAFSGSVSGTNNGNIYAIAGDATGYVATSRASGMSAVIDENNGLISLTNNGYIRVRSGISNSAVSSVIMPDGAVLAGGSIAAGMYAEPIVGFGGGGLDTTVNKSLTNTGIISAQGSQSYGMFANGNAGTVDIINSASGSIVTSGDSGAGIYASTTNNIITINNAGFVDSTNGPAIIVRNINTLTPSQPSCGDRNCSTTITNSGILRGLGGTPENAAILIDPRAEGNSAPTIVNNSGVITTQSGAISDYAIVVRTPETSHVTVNNTGTIVGRFETSQQNAVVTNNSTWLTTGTSSFLGGGAQLSNSATSLLASVGDTTILMNGEGNSITNAGTIQTIGGNLLLDPPNNAVTIYNSGLIDMSNDGVNSVSNTVKVDGNFVASGNSTVAVNSQLGGIGSLSDRLIIVGNASGSNTNVVVRDTKGGVGAYNPFGTAVVGVAGDRSSTFTLDPSSDHFALRNGMGVLNKGLYFYYLGAGAGSTGCDNGYTCYSLYSAPSTAAKSLPITVTAVQSLWQETALMWEDRQVELRDELTARDYTLEQDKSVSLANGKYHSAPQAKDGGISTWVKSVGAWTNRSNYQSQMGGGGNVLSYDLSYRQNSFGMLGGADWAKASFITPNDYFVVGVMGGYLNSSVNFNREAGNLIGQENFSYTGGTIGASVSYMLNGFFADAMFKNDLLRSNMMVPVSGLTNSSAGVNTAGGIGNLGYRFNYGSTFFEPIATLTYSNTYMGGLNNLAAQGVNISFGPGNDFRGGFGGRVGSTLDNLIDKHAIELSLTGRYWNMFNSNAGRTATIVSENISDTIGDYTYGRSYGEIKGNVNVFALGSGISAFVNTGFRFNDHFQTVITKGGLAYRF